MRALIVAVALALGSIGPAQAFTCSSPEVTNTLKQIDYDNHWKGLQSSLNMQGANVDLKERHDVFGISAGNDACRATLTYTWNDARGEEHTTSAVAAYTFNATDDGKSVYVNVSYEKDYDTPPREIVNILATQKWRPTPLGEASPQDPRTMAEKNREYFAKHPQYMGDDGPRGR